MSFLKRLFRLVTVEERKSQPELSGKEKEEDISEIIDNLEDPTILEGLDNGQQKAVLSENPRTLVLAGAGAGKTKVLLHRILHLIKNKKINSINILAMTFTRNATNEMLDRLIEDFEPKYERIKKDKKESELRIIRNDILKNYPKIRYITIRTIHSLCYTILKRDGSKVFDTNFKVVGDQDKRLEGFKKSISQQQIIKTVIFKLAKEKAHFLDDIKEFIIDYLIDYKKILKNNDYPTYGRYVTLDSKRVRSKSERVIANFLYQQGIRYEYEKLVGWVDKDNINKTYKPDFYLPDYDVYIEHWWVSSPKDAVEKNIKNFDKEKYLKDREWKLKQFKKHNKTLIQSSEKQMKGKINEYYDYLYSELYDKTGGAIKLKPAKDVIEKISHLREGLNLLITSLMKIINLAKSNSVSEGDIRERLKDEKHNFVLRFYGLFFPIFQGYREYLVEESLIDYNDMIHKVIKLFKINKDVLFKYKQQFKHILVDEYQDVSAAQVELIKLLLTNENNLFAVGDDWQSIYGFRGSEVEFIVEFKNDFKNSKRIILPYNYRSGNNIVNASNVVIKKNSNQINKDIEAFYRKKDEKIFQFNAINDKDGGKFIMEIAKKYFSEGYKSKDILFLYRRTSQKMEYDEYFKKYNFKINKKTIHSSKGLESKIVFLVGLKGGIMGFPCVWEDDRIIRVIKEISLLKKNEEERRVFYVAMTRAQERLFLISEKSNESEYCNDIPDEFKKIKVSKSEITEEMLNKSIKETLIMINNGKSVEEIAKTRGKEERVIEWQTAKLIEYGLLDINKFVDKEIYELIKSNIPKNEDRFRLIPVKRSLPSNITFAQIRYVIGDMKRKNELTVQ